MAAIIINSESESRSGIQTPIHIRQRSGNDESACKMLLPPRMASRADPHEEDGDEHRRKGKARSGGGVTVRPDERALPE